jgi:hypothetical protein
MLVPDIWDKGRDGTEGCRSRRGVEEVGEVTSDMVFEQKKVNLVNLCY